MLAGLKAASATMVPECFGELETGIFAGKAEHTATYVLGAKSLAGCAGACGG